MSARKRTARTTGTAVRRASVQPFDPRELMRAAERARRRAYAPYSRFPVGAALLLRDGRVVLGCNVENASYGLAACAERTAVWKAISDGDRDFVAIAITAREGQGAPPCGSCRQVMQEFAPRLRVLWRDTRGRILEKRLDELLPNAFQFKRGRR